MNSGAKSWHQFQSKAPSEKAVLENPAEKREIRYWNSNFTYRFSINYRPRTRISNEKEGTALTHSRAEITARRH